ncbi:GNAT family N-acetyltransferase [Treponema sp. OMZ 787]|uniref:GNAT family N-acetyltransferase n=1 Tax=Treponema sp. OMZ 787 TaxID=2563669 RepID=UPI0020A2688C|nr:GNAT family N-acetyltransferase [Treponema sp. OMZ 787]UTC63187.1 GNAT family N-acetyltransferase [Treponema sp. OMZ 787]
MNLSFRLSKDFEKIALMNKDVQELHYRLYPEYFKPFSYDSTVEFLKKQLQEDNWFCCIVSCDGKDAGYALFYIRDYQENPVRKAYRGIHIDQIGIDPEYRRKGLGKALMAEIEKIAVQEGASQIELTHWEFNEEAKFFYKNIGFDTCLRFVVKKL